MNKQFCMERSFLLRVLTIIMQAIIIHLIHVHVPTLLGLEVKGLTKFIDTL